MNLKIQKTSSDNKRRCRPFIRFHDLSGQAFQLLLSTVIFVLLLANSAVAATFDYANTTNLPIPDGASGAGGCITPVSRQITVSDSFTITDVDAGFVIEHGFSVDLVISVQSPAGTIVELVDQVGSGVDGEDFNVRFSDEAPSFNVNSINQNASNAYFDTESQIGGSDLLSDFVGENVNGIWTLTMCDTFTDGSPGDAGTLFGFYLHITDNVVPDPLIVTNALDTNTLGTLRFAMNHANSNAGDDDISFAIPGTGPHIISLTSDLPTITDSGITINGESQSGGACGQLSTGTAHTLMIHVDSNGAAERIFNVNAANTTLRGMALTGALTQAVRTNGSADDSIFECLYVGVEPDGVTKGPNATWASDSPAVRIISSSDVTIRNSLISGNDTQSTDNGIRMSGVSGAVIDGNIIGLNAAGTAALGNANQGILIDTNSTGIIIGGNTPETRNIISGNGSDGILFTGSSANGNNIFGNFIGLNQAATAALSNGGNGISITNNSNVAVYGNSIFGNTGLGIDLNGNGVTTNDSGDLDSGANTLLNFPVINSVGGNGSTTVEYDFNLQTIISTNGYRIDFFKSSSADGSGFGEGEIHLGSIDISHSGGDLNFTGSFVANAAVSAGDSISMTTTRKTGALTYDVTSEFSFSQSAVASGTIALLASTKSVTVLNTNDYSVPGTDMIYTFDVTNTGDGSTDIDTVLIIDALPPEVEYYNGDYDGPGPSTDRIGFSETATTLSFDPIADVGFSDAGPAPANFAACNYAPAIGYDAGVRFICLNPKGQMAGGDPDPTFSLSFRVRIK